MKVTNHKQPNAKKTGLFVDASSKSLGWVIGMVILNWTLFPMFSSYLLIRSYIEKKPMQTRDDEP